MVTCPRISFEYLKHFWHHKMLAASSNSRVAHIELILLQKTIINSGQKTRNSLEALESDHKREEIEGKSTLGKRE